MRNLKKVLSLVLALMMVLSVMVTASASYTDDADIEYKEAVAVLGAAGILEGRTDGSFAPDAALDRAAAAKIVAYIMLGDDIVYVGKTATDFTDVPSTHWASGFVNYCASEGVVAGVGNGTFLPGEKLTALAYAKMLLVALGYDSARYTNNGNWAYNIKKDAAEAELTKGMPATTMSLDSLTREQGAQMAFNAMKYSPNGVVLGYYYDHEDVDSIMFESYLDVYLFAKTEFGTEFDADLIKTDNSSTGSILATYGIYEADKAKYADEWGNPASKVWATTNDKGEEVAVYVEMQAATATFTSAVTDKALAAALKMKEADVAELNVTANGKLVNYYKSGSSYDVKVVEYTVATVSVGKADAKGSVSYALSTGDTYYDWSDDAIKADETKADDVVLHGDIVDGAVVTYAVDGDLNGHIYATSNVEGTLSAKTKATQQITIGGVKYALSAAANAVAFDSYAPTTDSDVYAVDQYGYVVGLATDAVVNTENIPTQFVYVLLYQTQAYSAGNTVGGSLINPGTTTGATTAAAKAQVIFTDGTTAVVDLEIYKGADKKTDTVDLPDNGEVKGTALTTMKEAAEVNGWYGYEVNEDGTYSLVALNEKTAQVVDEDTVIKANRTEKLDGYRTNSTTTINHIYTKLNETTGQHELQDPKVVSGMQSVDVTVKAGSLIVYAQNSTVVSAVYGYNTIVFGEAAEEPEYVKPDYYYAAAEGDMVIGGTKWTFYVNGDKDETKVISNTIEAGKVYTLVADKDQDGKLTGTYTATEVELAVAGKVELADATFFVANDVEYYYNTKGYEVYNVTGETEGTEDKVEAGDYVKVLVVNDYVTLIYIVDAPKEA